MRLQLFFRTLLLFLFTSLKILAIQPPDSSGNIIIPGEPVGLFAKKTDAEPTIYYKTTNLFGRTVIVPSTLKELSTLSAVKGLETILYRYTSQLSNPSFNGSHISLYGEAALPYIWYQDIGSLAYKLDTIPQAESINAVALDDSTGMFANISQSDTNYLFRKYAGGNWQYLPLVIREETGNTNYGLWFGLAALFMAALAAGLSIDGMNRRRIAAMQGLKEIEELMALESDAPLTLKGKEKLNDVEHALYEVIRNPFTPKPMTIVVNGEWGSGKSSIMSRVMEKLEQDKGSDRFITCWFNVWHQETEANLINAFLLKVIEAYKYCFYKRNFFSTLSFRSHLFRIRFRKQNFLQQVMTGFVFLFLLSFVVFGLLWLFEAAFTDNYYNNEWTKTWVSRLTHGYWNGLFPADSNIGKLLTGGLALLSALYFGSDVKGSGVEFFKIMSQRAFSFDAERTDPGFREKFRRDFWEIMEAVGNKNLVVFIDDLDRVGGDKILDLLEALNFISDTASRPEASRGSSASTNSVFVMGMYVEEVARNLGKKLCEINAGDFENSLYSQGGKQPGTDPVNGENVNPSEKKAGQSEEERKLQLYQKKGLRYIEKMVQLTVAVPFEAEDNNNQPPVPAVPPILSLQA
jgi:hypothetical protein